VAAADGPTDVTVLVAIFVGLLGLVIGSFLNVCIYRLPRSESVTWPASHCTSCGRTLAWYENVPLVSWLVLRGRCRTCGAAISPLYPIVEVITGAVFLAGYVIYGATPLLAARLLFACAMIVLFFIDLRHHVLPNVITLPGIAIGFALSFLLPPGWLASLIGLLAGGGLLFAIAEAYYRLRGVEGLGMGDVKMLAMIGAFLGWKLMLVTLVFASFAGSLVGIGIIAAGRGSMKLALPFGTFLAVGALLSAVLGDAFLDWYLQFYE
jgi:leader peptidase (prepilin peptidase)/N-methyltransferase